MVSIIEWYNGVGVLNRPPVGHVATAYWEAEGKGQGTGEVSMVEMQGQSPFGASRGAFASH